MAHSSQLFSNAFTIGLITFQTLLLVLYATCTGYSDFTEATPLGHRYPMFQDVHVMIFVGFGFLMTFLRTYSFSAVGLNFLLAALAVQWSTFTNRFFEVLIEPSSNHSHTFDDTVHIDVETLIKGDFAAGAVLITFGALLGKATPVQMLVVVFSELLFYSLNEAIGVTHYEAVDMGGSMQVDLAAARAHPPALCLAGRPPTRCG